MIYDCNPESFADYQKLQREFIHVDFIHPTYYAEGDFKTSLFNVLLDNSSPYILLSTDQVSLKQSIPLSTCIEAMRKTGAYGFCFHLGTQSDNPGVYMWNVQQNRGALGVPDSLEMGFYRRFDLEKTWGAPLFFIG